MKTSQQIRQEFIDFFVKKHGHTFVPSSPVVPLDDPTLLFTNAGMNQFKPIFLGQVKRAYTRAANTQKCIRAGGKHNDLDDVGRSRRHHTFFEMLGNWSFGDYFKQGAIEMSWELLTKVWGLDPTRLHVSCYEGFPEAKIPRDDEAADIWRKVANWEQYGLKSDDHIHYFGADNFWAMGDTGPCGPCTEIYYDRTPDKTGGPQVNGSDPRVMEIWNNVFIQFDRDASGKLTPLPAQHVDTGMGLERITQVLQDVTDNYAIDLFNPFWVALRGLSGITYGGRYPTSNTADPVAEAADSELRHDIAFRVIADHARMATFAIVDGALPGNKGRDSVVRSVIRRAVRFGYQQLELKQPFLWQLAPVVAQAMGSAFPEVSARADHAANAIKVEEESFFRTLARGIGLFEEAAERATVQRELSADDIFHLHTTYGFPPDMTQQMASERGLGVDMEGYKKLFKQFQEESGSKRSSVTQQVSEMKGLPGTVDEPKFLGRSGSARVLAFGEGSPFTIVTTAGGRVNVGEEAVVLLDRTCFYAEQGGQVGDTGEIKTSTGTFRVEATIRAGDYVFHEGVVTEGSIDIGSMAELFVSENREKTQQNHTTTHLANWALREVLGNDVQQKGSLVDPEKLRFDFSHPKSVTDDELGKVELLVNQGIEKKLAVYAEEAPQELALKINGLRAVFGEKYPPRVRVVSIGAPVADLLKDPGNEKWRQYSIEFCGGTHLRNSSEAETFAIIAEESVSKGIRRIVALTGEAALAAGSSAKEIDSAIENAQSTEVEKLPAAIAAIQKQLSAVTLPLRAKRKAQSAIGELQSKYKTWEKSAKSQAGGTGVDVIEVAGKLLAEAADLGGGRIIVGEIPGVSDDNLRRAIDSLKKRATTHGILLASSVDGKVTFIAAVSDDLVNKGLKAGDWVKEAAKVAGGSGGGRPQMAQAGGKDASKITEAIETAKKFAATILLK